MERKLSDYRTKVIFAVVVLIFLFFAYQYFYKYFYVFKDPAKMKNMILSYGKYSIIAFIIIQVLQVVIFFIPGEVVQVSGGYIYGTFLGGIISLAGITLGSAICFSLAYYLGRPFVKKIILRKHEEYFRKLHNRRRKNMIVLILYIIPGVPKDVLAYICGASDVTFRSFIILSTIGRIPGIFMSTYFGANINSGNKQALILISIIIVLISILGILKGEKILNKLEKENSD